MPDFVIAQAMEADLADIRALFREYAATLPISLGYQGFEAELAALPGRYATPEGRLFIARDQAGTPDGCVALRFLAPLECEMKRLYVRPSARGTGLGSALATLIINEARDAGYTRMRLDTLSSMENALALYRRLGFVETSAYYETPVAETVFMALAL
jgi:ribosomal protein S18 acetylase RimI-like enzyme